jgi:hypothetical protein
VARWRPPSLGVARWCHPSLGSGKMASPIPREWQDGVGHGVAPSWWQHFPWLPAVSKGSLKWNTKTCYMQHTGSKQQSVIGIRHLPMRDRCLYELVILMKRTSNWSKLRWDLKGFVVSLDVTSLDSFGELVIGCRTFFPLNIISCPLVLKAYLILRIWGLEQMAVNL